MEFDELSIIYKCSGLAIEVKYVYKVYFKILRALRELRGENILLFRLVRARDRRRFALHKKPELQIKDLIPYFVL